ncbi:MAG: hypothetical protein OXC83_08770 [Chloroflexi bacterium]|nr:hypothetical protein [Chloroflexota bacterium]
MKRSHLISSSKITAIMVQKYRHNARGNARYSPKTISVASAASRQTTPGQVSAITNYYTVDGIAGYSTRFEGFTIWSAD